MQWMAAGSAPKRGIQPDVSLFKLGPLCGHALKIVAPAEEAVPRLAPGGRAWGYNGETTAAGASRIAEALSIQFAGKGEGAQCCRLVRDNSPAIYPSAGKSGVKYPNFVG